MSEKDKKKKNSTDSEFDDHETAFFERGDKRVEGSITGEYMEEDFGTELWEDFDLPLKSEEDLDPDIRPPKVKVENSERPPASQESTPSDDFSIDGFDVEEPLTELTEDVSISDFGLELPSETLSFSFAQAMVEEDEEFSFDELEDLGFDDTEVTVRIPIPLTAQVSQGIVERSMLVEEVDERPEPESEPIFDEAVVDDFAMDDFAMEDFAIEEEPPSVSVQESPSEEESLPEIVFTRIPKTDQTLADTVLLREEGKQTKQSIFFEEAALRSLVRGNPEESLNILSLIGKEISPSREHYKIMYQAAIECRDVRLVQEAQVGLLSTSNEKQKSALYETGAEFAQAQGNKTTACTDFSLSITHNPSSAYAHFTLAQLSKELGNWQEYIDGMSALAQLSPPELSSEFLLFAAEASLERLENPEQARTLIAQVQPSSDRMYQKIMTQLGWPNFPDHDNSPTSLFDLYSALKNRANGTPVLTEHSIFRWLHILQAPKEKQIDLLKKNLSFSTGIEAQITQILLARKTGLEEAYSTPLLKEDPSAIFTIEQSLSSFAQAQELVEVFEEGKHSDATRFAILSDLYKGAENTSSNKSRKLGRSWLGIRRGAITTTPPNISALFDFPDAGVIQELWYIQLSMKPELESLYLERARTSTQQSWKAHWIFQAGLVNNNRSLFKEARALQTDMPVAYTQEYISAWKDWQFSQGTQSDCLTLLKKQAELCDLPEYHFAVALFSGADVSFGENDSITSLLSSLRRPAAEKISTLKRGDIDIFMEGLTEHEQAWVALSLLLAEPPGEIFSYLLRWTPKLPSALLFALSLQSFSVSSPELFEFLHEQMGNDLEENELRVVLLFLQKNERLLSETLSSLSVDAIRGEISVLAELEGMWNITKTFAEHPEEILYKIHPESETPRLHNLLAKEPNPHTAMCLIHAGIDPIPAYRYLLSRSVDTPLEECMSRLLSKALRDGEERLPYLAKIFTHSPVFGEVSMDYFAELSQQGMSDDLLKASTLLSEEKDEIGFRLMELESWTLAKSIVQQSKKNSIRDYRLEAISHGLEDWEDCYALLRKRMDSWSTGAQNDAEQRCASLMLEQLTNKPYTLQYYQHKSKQHPQDVDILEALARISIAQGDVDGGIQTLTLLYEQARDAPSAAQYLFRISQALCSESRPLPAIEKLKHTLDIHPTYTEARTLIKELLYEGNYYESLVQVLQQEIEIVEDVAKRAAMVELATLYVDSLQDYDQAIDIWSKIWHEEPENKELLQTLLSIAHKTEKEERIVFYMQELVQLVPEADMLMELSNRYSSLGDFDRLEATLIQAVGFPSVVQEAMISLSNLYREKQDMDSYTKIMFKRVGVSTSLSQKVLLLEQTLVENEKSLRGSSELYRICAMITEFEPNHANALNVISEFHYDAGEYEQAIPFFERLSKNKNYASSNTFDGRLAYSDFLFRYGTSLNKLQRKDAALEVLNSLLEILPYHLQGLRLIGPLLIEKEDWNQASQVYKSLLMNVGSGSAESLEIYTILGEIDMARNLYDHAIQYFVRAFRMAPDDNRVLRSLAQICVTKKNWNKALQLYQKIISSGTSSKEVTMEGMLIKAWILDKQLGHTDISFKHLEQSLQFESNQPIVLLCMAEIRFNQGNFSEALSLIEKMVSLEESAYHNLALMLKSACLEQSGEEGEAQAIQAFLNVDSSSSLAQQILDGFSKPLY